jgi:hypothetical protein
LSNAFGSEAALSALLPATNAMVEPEVAALRIVRVTSQTFRLPFPSLPPTAADLFDLMGSTVDLAMACEPDQFLVGYTPECMDGAGSAASRRRSFVEDRTGLPVTLAIHAVSEALKAPNVQRISSRRCPDPAGPHSRSDYQR